MPPNQSCPLTEEQRLLVENNVPLITFCLWKPKRWYIKDVAVSYADLWQIGALGLIFAAIHYDPARGAFSTYACPHIIGAVLRYTRGLRADKRLAHSNSVSLDRSITNGDAKSATLGDLLPGEQDVETESLKQIASANVFARLEAELSPYAQTLLAMKLDGASHQEIAQRLGIRQRDAQKYLTVITHRVKQLLAECVKEEDCL